MINIAIKNKRILISKKFLNSDSNIKFICDNITNINNHIESKNLIINMYRPFFGKILTRFLNEILNYNLFIIYNNPMELKSLTQLGLKVLNTSTGFHPSLQTSILSNNLYRKKY